MFPFSRSKYRIRPVSAITWATNFSQQVRFGVLGSPDRTESIFAFSVEITIQVTQTWVRIGHLLVLRALSPMVADFYCYYHFFRAAFCRLACCVNILSVYYPTFLVRIVGKLSWLCCSLFTFQSWNWLPNQKLTCLRNMSYKAYLATA